MRKRIANLIGTKFNNFTVIGYSGAGIYQVQCICGKVLDKNNNFIKRTKTKSCGCIREHKIENCISRKIGKLTITKTYFVEPTYRCDCICDCGNVITNKLLKRFLSKHYASCGKCDKDELMLKFGIGKHSKLSSEEDAVKFILFREYPDVSFSFKEFHCLIKQNCFYCGSAPLNKVRLLNYNGVDRIDSSLPHTTDNVVPCCKHCNLSKRSLGLYDFLSKIIFMNKQIIINRFIINLCTRSK